MSVAIGGDDGSGSGHHARRKERKLCFGATRKEHEIKVLWRGVHAHGEHSQELACNAAILIHMPAQTFASPEKVTDKDGPGNWRFVVKLTSRGDRR